MFTLPLPFGVKLISPFDDVVILTVDESLIVKFSVALESQPFAFTPFQIYEPEMS